MLEVDPCSNVKTQGFYKGCKGCKISRNILSTIDNQWSDYFFKASDPDTFDERFFNFLHYVNVFFALKEELEEKSEGNV